MFYTCFKDVYTYFYYGVLIVVLVKARVRVEGSRQRYACVALVDTGARMTLIDEVLADKLGVEYTGRRLDFISVSGHKLSALEAIVRVLEIEDVKLKSEPIAVAEFPDNVKRVLRSNQVDENMIIGLLTLERANLVPDTTTGSLKKTETFVI